MGEAADTVSNVEEKVAEEVPEGDLKTTENLGDVEFLPEGQLGPVDDFYCCGHDGSPKKTNTTAVTTTLTTAMGKSPFQPNAISWS